MLQLRQSLKLMQCWKGKLKEQSELVNGKHVTLNDMKQVTKLCTSIGTKGVLPKKDIT